MSSLLNVRAIFWLLAGIPFGFLFGFYRREIWIIASLQRKRIGFGIFNESISYSRAVLAALQHGRSWLGRSFNDKAELNIHQPAPKVVSNSDDETTSESVVARIHAARINKTSLLNASRNNPSLENKTVTSFFASVLAKRVRIFCWILTGAANRHKAERVKQTWAVRCNDFVFISTINDSSLPSVAPEGVKEGRDWLWAKTRGAFRYIYEQGLLKKFDWFLKADDDTYVLLENLRYLLAWRNASDPIHYGFKFRTGPPGGYMSGGGGYVLSKEAVRRFVEVAQPNRTLCSQEHDGSEDVEIGTCLGNVGVLAGDSRDRLGRHRFFPMSVGHFVLPSNPHLTSWVAGYTSYPIKTGQDCCSDYAITFHYISPQWLLVMDYLVYHLRPYGLSQTQHFVLKPNSSDEQSSSSIGKVDHKLAAQELVPLSLEDMANKTRTSTTEQQSIGTYNETALRYQALMDAIALKAPEDNFTNSNAAL